MQTPSHPAEHGGSIETIREQIKDIRMAMLSTFSRDGKIVARPMGTNTMGKDGTLWFLTPAGSRKVEEIENDPRVGLAYTDHGAETYVSIAGTAKISNDRARIRELWNPFLKAWFEGPDDPNIRLVVVTPQSAEYWMTKGGKIVSILSALASAVTGKNLEAGENREVTL